MFDRKFKSLKDILKRFPTEQSCVDYLEARLWNGNVISPYDSDSKVTKGKNNNYWCSSSRRYFNVKTGTIFENTKVPLTSWFLAIYLVTSFKKGISSCQLAREIEVTQKTAWFMLKRIHNCFGIDNHKEQFKEEVEADETYVGGKAYNKHAKKKKKGTQGRSTKDKTAVFGIIERNGEVVAEVIKNADSKTLLAIIEKYVTEGITIYTDEFSSYVTLSAKYDHEIVRHKSKQYVNGNAHTNSIENYWSHLKRMITGIHHWVSPRHLQYYVDSESFRYNTCEITTYERFNLTLQQANKRLKYKDLISNDS